MYTENFSLIASRRCTHNLPSSAAQPPKSQSVPNPAFVEEVDNDEDPYMPCARCHIKYFQSKMDLCHVCQQNDVSLRVVVCKPCKHKHFRDLHQSYWVCRNKSCARDGLRRANSISPPYTCEKCQRTWCNEPTCRAVAKHHRFSSRACNWSLCGDCQKPFKSTPATECSHCPVRRCNQKCMENHLNEKHNSKPSVVLTHEETLCVVCFASPKCVAFVPCGHVSCCEPCSKQMEMQCPICRTLVREILRVYY